MEKMLRRLGLFFMSLVVGLVTRNRLPQQTWGSKCYSVSPDRARLGRSIGRSNVGEPFASDVARNAIRQRTILDCGGKRSATPLSDVHKSRAELRLPPQSKARVA